MQKVTAAIITRNNKIFIARRKATDYLAHKWEFPGGKIKDGETPQECLKRELQEELNIQVSVGRCLGECIYRYAHGTIQLIAYQAFWEKGNSRLVDHAEYCWASADQLAGFDFSPADQKFVRQIVKGHMRLDPNIDGTHRE